MYGSGGAEKEAERTANVPVKLVPGRRPVKKCCEKEIGKNSLVVSILDKYVEWDSVVSDFGYLTVPPEMIGMLISSLDRESIASIAKAVSKKVASLLPLWYGSADLDSLLKYLEASVKYTGARLPQRIERQGSVVRIIMYQPFNENGSNLGEGFQHDPDRKCPRISAKNRRTRRFYRNKNRTERH